MADSHEKGAFQADIPTTAVEEALRSVERLEKGGAEEPGAAAPEPGAAEGEALAPDEVIRLQTQLELAQVAEREAQERLREERDRLLRAAADLENFKKRAQRERDEIQKFGIERVLKDLLPVLDDLDRALAAAPAGDPMAEGVQLVRAGFEQALARHGVKGFSALGQPFDPNLHEALMQVPTTEAPPGTVVLQHARGFTLHERLLRPAMVGVAIEPPSGA